MKTSRPWYGFLYYVLGARGSFVVWIIAVTGVYFTWRDAVLYAFNQAPRDATVREVASGDMGLKKWVRVGGVEVDLGSALLGLAGAPEAGGGATQRDRNTILIDKDEGAAKAWQDLLSEVEAKRAPRPGETTDDEAERLKDLWALINEESMKSQRPRFTPERAMVVVEVATSAVAPTASAAVAEGQGADVSPLEQAKEAWRRKTTDRIEQIRRAVRLDVTRIGILQPSAQVEQKYRSQYGIEVTRSVLIVGSLPSPVFAYCFAGFATVLFFLLIGLRALRAGAPALATAAG